MTGEAQLLAGMLGGKRAAGPPKPRALYIIPHQDDEVLTGGGPIITDVLNGFDVYTILITSGSAPPPPQLVERLGYTPTNEQVSAQRDKEFREASIRLGATPIVPSLTDRTTGNATTARTVSLVKAYAPWSNSAVLRATSNYDYHADHRTMGWSLIKLIEEGWGSDPRLMVNSFYPELWPAGVPKTPMGAPFSVTEYHQWPYKTLDIPSGWWGFGYSQATAWFNAVVLNGAQTNWHRPVDPGSAAPN